ncbi:MAG: MarR family EPS-associated transcriptional regulator [Arcobacteraceae bacterium]|nr:MarR family EPS-associated transcriptional regulator [Arcobacteraceae bacterium]MDY0364497.1 MarR family EPS-associated transcriptional regulator [Arcobacteraceae bacterium]
MQEIDLHVLRKVDKATTQKSLADEVGVSVGKLNYVLNALIDKGYVKAERFVNSKNKIQYKYLLTPQGMSEKINLTKRFVARKKAEYEELRAELEEMKRCNI